MKAGTVITAIDPAVENHVCVCCHNFSVARIDFAVSSFKLEGYKPLDSPAHTEHRCFECLTLILHNCFALGEGKHLIGHVHMMKPIDGEQEA